MNPLEVLGAISAVVSIIGFVWYLYDKRSPYRRLSWRFAQKAALRLTSQMIADNFSPTLIMGVGRGGAIFGSLISGCFGHRPLLVIDRKYEWNKKGRNDDVLFNVQITKDYLKSVLLVAGEAHSGNTMSKYFDYLQNLKAKNIRRAVLLYEEGCPVKVEYIGLKTSRKNLLLPWMFSKQYRRDDRGQIQ